MIREVVPYIGTWIETMIVILNISVIAVVPYIGTWIETYFDLQERTVYLCRTLYRYVD